MIIQHNISALRAYNNWTQHGKRVSKAMGRLSSGYRINSSADDPAGFAISERMKAQISMLKREKMNTMDAMSSIAISEGIQSEVSDMLLRMTELATESMNGTMSDEDREKLDMEFQQLMEEIDRVNGGEKSNPISLFGKKDGDSKTSEMEGIVITGSNLNAYLDGLDAYLMDIARAAQDGDKEKLTALGVDLNLATDEEKVQKAVLEFTKNNAEKLLSTPGGGGETVSIHLSGGNVQISLLYSDTKDLGLAGTDIKTAANAGKALEAVKNASSIVSKQRAQYGAISNRLEHSINLISTMEQNMEEALSRIVDADMAKEMMEFVRGQALQQAAMFVMTYATQEPQQVLQLLRAV